MGANEQQPNPSATPSGAVSSVPICKRHPGTPATGTCVRCLASVCDVCSAPSLDGTVCVECIARGLRRARAVRIGAVVTVLACAGAVSPYVLRAAKEHADEVKKGAPLVLQLKSAELNEALAKEPCDRRKMIDFCESLLRDGEPRYCLTRSDEFFTRCGDFWRLRWLTYEAHKRLSEWDAAIAEVSKLVEQFPDDKDYRTWRGLAYEEKKDWTKAAADYEQAIAIEPRLLSIPFNLASAYRQLGRPCDGIFPLEQMSFHNPDRDANARRRLTELYDDPKCSDRLGTGKATIRFRAGARQLASKVTINGAKPAELIVDTGASSVTLGAALAKRLGLPYERWPAQRALTAAGIKEVRVGYLDEVTVQGLTARHVECAVIDDLVGADGLLGLSFLSRFEMHTDAQKGVLELVDRRSAH